MTPQLEYRSIDGSGNNLQDPDLNQAGTDFARVGPANFADGFDAMQPGVNPRVISNVVVAGNPPGDLQVNGVPLSGMMYAWGQFIDHDLDLENAVPNGANISVTVPAGDSLPPGTTIPINRVAIDPATGVPGSPATAINSITGWLDGSMVYGSDQATADSLRLPDGHMKTSAGDNLPIDPVTGQFMAGDVRAQENPDLTALQTLFVREHNFQVDQLAKEHPDWTGDQLYNMARAITTAEIANITYSEFLPHLLGPNAIPAYRGYNPNVNPTITEEFEGAAYRFGHSIVSNTIDGINNLGATTSSDMLANVFFEQPSQFNAQTADALLRHLAGDTANPLDTHIVEDLRSFLNDPPDAIDLAATNIQRGRDLGLGTLNETRVALGLTPYTHFSQITSDPTTAAALAQAYNGDINSVDLWTGGLAEDHTPGAAIGPTFGMIIANQFTALRDGDRLYFENQFASDPALLDQIKNTTLSDIIERDTDTQHIQDDVFVFYDRHSGTAGGVVSANPSAPQLVIGSVGPDTLTGGPKGDILVAGTGQQTMTGGGGADKFVFDQVGPTNATITDFLPGTDKIELDGLQSSTAAGVNEVNGNTVIHVGDDQITLAGVTPNRVSPDDFIKVFTPAAPPSGPNPPPPAGTTAVMIMSNPSDGTYEVYNVGGNAILAAHRLGQVGTPWTFAALGTFQAGDSSDMLLRNSSTGAFEAYYVSGNNITNAVSVGAVGLDWSFAGIGNFDGASSLSELMLRNASSGSFELYHVAGGGVLSGNSVAPVGNNFQVKGFGNFSGSPVTQMIMQDNTNDASAGQLELYTYQPSTASLAGINVGKVGSNLSIVGCADLLGNGMTQMVMQQNNGNFWLYSYNAATNSLSGTLVGAIGSNFHVVGFGPLGTAGRDEMLMQDAAGNFEVYQYNASLNAFVGNSMGAVGAPWVVDGIAADPPSAAGISTAQLVQAMAGFDDGSGAAVISNTAPLSAETSQQTFLAMPQHA